MGKGKKKEIIKVIAEWSLELCMGEQKLIEKVVRSNKVTKKLRITSEIPVMWGGCKPTERNEVKRQ